MPNDTLDAAFARAASLLRSCEKAAASGNSLQQQMGLGSSYMDPLTTGTLQSQGAYEQERHFKGWVYAAIKQIAQKIAEQPLRVGRRHSRPISAGKHGFGRTKYGSVAKANNLPAAFKSHATSIEVYDSHPILKDFKRPNEVMGTWQLLFTTIAALELTGRGFWWMPKNPATGRRDIWPIPPSWMIPQSDGKRAFAKWIMRPPNSYEGGQPIPAEEVVYFFYPEPANPFGSSSPFRAQVDSVFADESMQEAQAYTFKNRIFPSLAVIAGDVTGVDGESSEPPVFQDYQRQQITQTMRKMFDGVGRYGSFAILDGLIKDIKPISNKPIEMDFMNSGEQMATRICTGFGVDPIIMGKIESANRATSATASERFAEWTLNPKIEMLSQTLTAQMAPMYGGADDLLIWLEPVRVKDRDARRADMKVAIAAGAITWNEIRVHLLDLPPVEGGDSAWVPNTMQQVEMMLEAFEGSSAEEERIEEEEDDAEEVSGDESPSGE